MILTLGVVAPDVDGAAVPSRKVIELQMVEFAFHPSTIQLDVGRPVRLVLINRGQIAHQFESAFLQTTPVTIIDDALQVEARGLDVIRVDPGRSARLEFLPRQRGRFAFACTIEGHREVGMKGTIVVR
jgi:uncharacterized cupredoxin-like copper-binding protein